MEDQKKLTEELKLLEAIEEAILPTHILFYSPELDAPLYLPSEKSIALKKLFPKPVSQQLAQSRCTRRGISAYFMAVNDPRFKQI